MVRLLWVLAWFAVAIWSLVAFAGYGLVELVGTLLARNADKLSDTPETVERLFAFLNGLKSFGLGAILVVWGAVSLAILGVPWFVGRAARAPRDLGFDQRVSGAPGGFFGPRRGPSEGLRPSRAPGQRPADPGVIDLTPDQYASDRPRPDAPRGRTGGGSVPKVGRS